MAFSEVATVSPDPKPLLPAIEELRSFKQWVAWRYEQRGEGKPTKPPVNPHTGYGASHSNPEHWGTYAQAEWRYKMSKLAGVGFVLAETDPFTGIDLDKCRDPETGELEPWAAEIVALAESYTEVSPSETGIRIICRGKVPKATKSDVARVEIYGSHRYLTITERHVAGTPTEIREAPRTIEALLKRVAEVDPKRDREEPAPAPARTSANAAALDDERVRAWRDATVAGILDDFANLTEGGRNTHLNDVAAYRLGRLAASGYITQAEAWDGCKDACVKNGLLKDDGARQCRQSFESGFAAGMRDPHPGPKDRDQLPSVPAGAFAELLKELEDARETMIVDGLEIDVETGEIIGVAMAGTISTNGARQSHDRETGRTKTHVELVVASSFAGKPVPPQEWLVKDLIPANNVTMLMGDGGTGKSLLSLQLAVAVATGGTWIGFRPKPGKVLFVSAEDEIEELHRRLARNCPRLETLDNLAIVPLAGEDAVLAAPVGSNGLLKETPLFRAILHIIAKHRPHLLILDTLADLFGGDEIKKVQVRQFLNMLRKPALKYGVTVLLLGHPSQNGINSGTGESGNKAWNNSVRSRLYFERRVVSDGRKTVEDDVNVRVLKTMKANRAAIGGQIVVRYDKGMFVREEQSAVDAREAAHMAECVFIELLAKFTAQGRKLSPTPCAPTYAPTVFAKDDEGEGIKKRSFEQAMSRLFTAGRIMVKESGPPSKRRQTIVLAQRVDEASMACDEDSEIEDEGIDNAPERPPEMSG